MISRPRVALTLATPDTEPRRRARARYVSALARAGADVIEVLPGDEPPAAFDALCLSGGEDLAPDRYGEADQGCEIVSPERDETELALIARARAMDVPILGICRGFQVLNVAFGGSLVQHLEGHRPADVEGFVQHTVTPVAGSRLARATTGASHVVNSRHHQAVTADRLAPGLVATASVDGLVEAFEATGHRWVVGIQWHPERTSEVDAAAARIFEALVRATERVPAR